MKKRQKKKTMKKESQKGNVIRSQEEKTRQPDETKQGTGTEGPDTQQAEKKSKTPAVEDKPETSKAPADKKPIPEDKDQAPGPEIAPSAPETEQKPQGETAPVKPKIKPKSSKQKAAPREKAGPQEEALPSPEKTAPHVKTKQPGPDKTPVQQPAGPEAPEKEIPTPGPPKKETPAPAPPSEPAVPPEDKKRKQLLLAILKDLKADDEREYDEEENENHNIKDELDWIQAESNRIPEGMNKLDAEFDKIFAENLDDSLDSLPAALKDNLLNRQESLNLCYKMLKRLDRLYPQFKESQDKVEKLPELKKYVWHDQDVTEMTPDALEKYVEQVKKDLEGVRDFNYHSIRQKRELYQKQKSYFKKFFKDYFFHIIDGLVDGQNFYDENMQEWITEHKEHESVIRKRFAIYDLLINAAEKTLSDFHIFPIPVKEGEKFDEEIHDPFMTEPDEKLKDDQVKEVSKKGYKFVDPDDKKSEIIRSPQVIVVKNTGEVNES